MTETKDLIDQIVARYGVRIGPDDPIMMVYLLLEERGSKDPGRSRKLLCVFQGATASLFSREIAPAQELELAALV